MRDDVIDDAARHPNPLCTDFHQVQVRVLLRFAFELDRRNRRARHIVKPRGLQCTREFVEPNGKDDADCAQPHDGGRREVRHSYVKITCSSLHFISSSVSTKRESVVRTALRVLTKTATGEVDACAKCKGRDRRQN